MQCILQWNILASLHWCLALVCILHMKYIKAWFSDCIDIISDKHDQEHSFWVINIPCVPCNTHFCFLHHVCFHLIPNMTCFSVLTLFQFWGRGQYLYSKWSQLTLKLTLCERNKLELFQVVHVYFLHDISFNLMQNIICFHMNYTSLCNYRL